MTVIGFTARLRALVAFPALILAGAACGGSGSPSSTTSETTITTTVRTEPSGTESPRPTANGASVSLPTLPIGGPVDDVDQGGTRKCVRVSWTGHDIAEGATVTVTSIGFTESGVFTLDRGGNCGTPNCAASFSFTRGHIKCGLAVRATSAGGKETSLKLSGIARCTSAGRHWCDTLSVEGETIGLTQPSTSPPTPTHS